MIYDIELIYAYVCVCVCVFLWNVIKSKRIKIGIISSNQEKKLVWKYIEFCVVVAIFELCCWRSKDELISDVLLWTPTHGRANVGRLARIYIHHLCVDNGCNLEDQPGAMNDRDGWRLYEEDIFFGLVSLFNGISTFVSFFFVIQFRLVRNDIW